MKIVALRGKSKTGKTTTLVEVARLIKNNCKIIKEWRGKKECCLLATVKGKTILLISAGDTVEIIKYNLKRILGEKNIALDSIDLLLLACHQGETSEYIKKIDEESDIIFINNPYIDSNNSYILANKLHKDLAVFIYDKFVI